MGGRKRVLTPADERAAARARDLWADYQRKHPGVSQESAAEDTGMSQSAFSQFLLARVPIGLRAALKLAALFQVEPQAIRDDLPQQLYSGAFAHRSNTIVRERAAPYKATERRARTEAEKLLAIVTAFIETNSRGRDALYEAARGVKTADEAAGHRSGSRAEGRARGRRQ
jgi:transcriptional regulator with XRE-family HTH domain